MPSDAHEGKPTYVLRLGCLACNREASEPACDLCAKIEYAETRAGNPDSPQLERVYVIGKRGSMTL